MDGMQDRLREWSKLERAAIDAEDEVQHLRLLGDPGLAAAEHDARSKRVAADTFLSDVLSTTNGQIRVVSGPPTPPKDGEDPA